MVRVSEVKKGQNIRFPSKNEQTQKLIYTKKELEICTNIEGFPVARISEQVMAPALETTRSAAAYAKCRECMNLKQYKKKKKHHLISN